MSDIWELFITWDAQGLTEVVSEIVESEYGWFVSKASNNKEISLKSMKM